MSEVLAWLEAEGVTGLGQSSWGPTGFAILGDDAQAAALQGEAERGSPIDRLGFMVTQRAQPGRRSRGAGLKGRRLADARGAVQ